MTPAARDFERDLREAPARLVGIWRDADPSVRRDGAAWYAEARRAARALAREAPPGIGPVACAAVIAALSPRTRWAENLRYARAAVRAASRVADDDFLASIVGGREEAIRGAVWTATEPVGLSDPRRKAARILAGENPDQVLGGPKVRAFWRNLCGSDDVTVDVWAQRAALGRFEAAAPSGRRYDAIADAYRRAARRVGVPAPVLQAGVWIAVRGSAA
jgi:hypothetical protein